MHLGGRSTKRVSLELLLHMAFEVSLSYIASSINNRLHKYSHFRTLRTKVVRRPHGYWISWPSYLQGSLGESFFAKISLILTISRVWLKEAGHFPWSQIVTGGNTCTYLLNGEKPV